LRPLNYKVVPAHRVFRHAGIDVSLILITRDLMELGVRHLADEMRGEDPEGTGLTTNEKLINCLQTDSINEPLPSNFVVKLQRIMQVLNRVIIVAHDHS